MIIEASLAGRIKFETKIPLFLHEQKSQQATPNVNDDKGNCLTGQRFDTSQPSKDIEKKE